MGNKLTRRRFSVAVGGAIAAGLAVPSLWYRAEDNQGQSLAGSSLSAQRDQALIALQQRLTEHLKNVVRERDSQQAPEGYSAVRAYITQQFSRFGSVEVHQFKHRDRLHENLILNLPGQQDGDFILVGAHYDAVPGSPGADDNGSAIAVLLELARAFSMEPARSPLRLVAFDAEEADRGGSRAYAQNIKSRNEPLAFMVSLEMIGYRDTRRGSQKYPPGLSYFYPDRGDFIAVIGNLRGLPTVWQIVRSMRRFVPCEWLPVPNGGHLIPDTRRSDHASFWDESYNALMITDTANLRNPNYHTANDRLETLDLAFLASVCAGLTAGLLQL
ncbi:M20/M25/M40 family metallo-hydrolase [Rhodoligotrophos ferricapiens]|uniref:M20/M25/M40 family metallo-hydrolase n=1 Tax=Rhodoligotrophos ferricapiens TaxID=3069264 RepID=UPI00315CD393